MSSDLARFQSPVTGHNIRVVEINGEPWFIAGDVALALGYRDAYNATRWLMDSEKATHQVSTPGGLQEVTIVSEAGLYRMIMRSNKEKAVDFQMWIAHEVMPSIRKTGGYVIARQLSAAELILHQAQRLVEHERAISEIRGDVTVLSARMDGIEQKTGWVAALGFSKLRGLPTDNPSTARLGREAARICRARNVKPGKVDNAVFGEVGLYPVDVLEEAAGIIYGAVR